MQILGVFNYCVYLDIPFCLTNKFSTITINTADIYSLDGTKQTGFAISKPNVSPYMFFQIQAIKQNNLLVESYLVINFTLDLRVY